jgi:hypothetical protein
VQDFQAYEGRVPVLAQLNIRLVARGLKVTNIMEISHLDRSVC